MAPPHPIRRNSLRYPWHDYADPGSIFVTICTHDRQRLLGEVRDGQMVHSPAGLLVSRSWMDMPDRFQTVDIDAFVVMPDHIHGIIFTGTNPDAAGVRVSVGDEVRWLKSTVARGYRTGVDCEGWVPYDTHLWHRNFYDRILRSQDELANRRRYIEGNPGRWWEQYGE